MSVTRLVDGRLNLHMSAELVEEVVKEALRHVNRLKSEHYISVEHEDDLLLARMDARLIVQVLINLIDNAIKYTQKDSHITVKTKERAHRLLSVSWMMDRGLRIRIGKSSRMSYCPTERSRSDA